MKCKHPLGHSQSSTALAVYPRGFVYQLTAIDFWVGFTPAHRIVGRPTSFRTEGVTADEISGLLNHATCEILRRSCWEGDLQEEPWIGGLPPAGGDCRTLLLVGFKQDNNGETFIWSPVELPWIREYEGPRDA